MSSHKKRAAFRKWTADEDAILRDWVATRGPKLWSLCARLFPDRSPTQCRERWKNSLDPSIKKGDWSEREDLALFRAIQKHLFSWKKVSLELEGRTRISCRNRFYNSIKSLGPKGFGGVFERLLLRGAVSDLGKRRFAGERDFFESQNVHSSRSGRPFADF